MLEMSEGEPMPNTSLLLYVRQLHFEWSVLRKTGLAVAALSGRLGLGRVESLAERGDRPRPGYGGYGGAGTGHGSKDEPGNHVEGVGCLSVWWYDGQMIGGPGLHAMLLLSFSAPFCARTHRLH